MKRILCLITIFSIGLITYAQNATFNKVRVRDELRVGDSTITLIGSDTLTNPAMVRQLISEGAGYTASNGITKVGSDFQLGGTQTKNTIFNGNSFDFEIGQPGSQFNNFDVWSSGTSNINADIFKITIPSYEWTFDSKTITGSDSDYLIYNSRLLSYVEGEQRAMPFVFLYEYQGVTSNVRPGVGFYATNSSTPSLITEIYIDDFDQNSVSQSNFIQLADTGSYFYIQEKGAISDYYMYQIISYADSSGWTVYEVDYKFSTGTIAETDNIELVLHPNNTTGSGGGTIDTFYVAGQDEWVFSGDTINYVDTSNYSLLSSYAYNSDSTSVSYLADTIKITSNTSNPHLLYNKGTSNSILHIAEENENVWIDLQGDESTLCKIEDLNGNYLQIDGNGAYVHGLSDAKMDVNNNYVRVYDSKVDIYSETGMKIENNSSSDLIISTGDDVYFSDADIVAIDTADIKRAIIDATETDTIESTNQIVVVSQGDEYKFIGDTLFAEQESGKFKYIEAFESSIDIIRAMKIDSDTNIIGGDTITGGIDLKDAVEAEQFTEINYKDTLFTTEIEGRLYYNESDKSLIFNNDISNFNHNLGYELVRRVYNNSGATITNGSAVRRTGTYTNGTRVPTIGLAGNGSYDSARVCGIATVDIANNAYGIITINGNVNFLNTTTLTEDDYYLGHAGVLIDTSPEPPYYSVDLGCVIYSDNDSGIVSVSIKSPKFDPLPVYSRYFTDSSISIDVTQDVYSLITNTANNAFIETVNKGFTQIGDSVQVKISGYYSTDFSASFQGTVSADTWKYGIFVNGVKEFSKTRYTASTNTGDVTVPHVIYLNTNDWVTWRITSTTSSRDPVMIDVSNSLIFLSQ